jgi:hypothetical protein
LEALVVGHVTLTLFTSRIYPRVYPAPPGLGIALAYSAALAWAFLLIASPFFLRSLRGVALAGLAIALCVLGYVLVGVFFS